MGGIPPKTELPQQDTVDESGSKSEKQLRHAAAEIDTGKRDAVRVNKTYLDQLKAGMKSGITNEFGKPELYDGQFESSANDKKSVGERALKVDPTLDPAQSDKSKATKTREIRSFYANVRADRTDNRLSGNKDTETI
jgi:hypothetical protein